MLVTLDDMKTYLGIPLIDTTQDSFLTEQIVVISSAVENYCGRIFAEATYTQTFYYDEFRDIVKELPLYHYPVSTIVSLEENAVAFTDEYRVKPKQGILVAPLGFFRSREDVVVEYTAGYSTIPAVIQAVVKSIVEERYRKKLLGVDIGFGSDIQQISIPGTINVSFDYSLQANERKTGFGMLLGNWVNTLDYYRSERPVVGEIRGGGYVS